MTLLNQQCNSLWNGTRAFFRSFIEKDNAEKWVAPQVDTIKVIVDAATFEEQEAFGFGMIAKN